VTTTERTVLTAEIAILSRSQLEADHELAIRMFRLAPAESVQNWREAAAIYARELAAREPLRAK
jgi:hypothetical protein